MKKLLLSICILALASINLIAQPPSPVVTVRFNNPQYDYPSQTYCLDVEFICDSPGYSLFGMNVRFFYDDDVLEYLSMGSFEDGYISMGVPEIVPGGPGSGDQFGISGPLEWFNGSVQLAGPPTIWLSNAWTKLFKVCFHVDDPAAVGIKSFCPSIIWDLQWDPLLGGYLPGDQGVVMTVVSQQDPLQSSPSSPHVVQYNWEYMILPLTIEDGGAFGNPVDLICIPTSNVTVIPLSDWSLYLAIGLMLITTLFIWRRRLS
jgi:hypothetical protein